MPDRDLEGSAASAPPTLRIAATLACMLALPLASYVTGSTVGSFRMFSDPHHYMLILHTLEAGQSRQLALSTLAPNLGLDARRWILSASQPTYGETAASLLAGGLDDLTRLVCRTEPAAQRAHAQLRSIDLRGASVDTHAELDCASARLP
jgi:hypothetical protein